MSPVLVMVLNVPNVRGWAHTPGRGICAAVRLVPEWETG